MPKRKQSYEEMLEDVVEAIKHSTDEFMHVLENSGKMVSAANNLTKDELALVSAYIQSDLKEFAQSYQESKSSPFAIMVTDSIWQALLDITDKTQVEWIELFADLDHQGLDQVGEVIGLGVLICDKCGNKTTYSHPTIITPCIKCGAKGFSRQALKP